MKVKGRKDSLTLSAGNRNEKNEGNERNLLNAYIDTVRQNQDPFVIFYFIKENFKKNDFYKNDKRVLNI